VILRLCEQARANWNFICNCGLIVKRTALSSKLGIEKAIFFILLAWVLIFCVKHYPQLLYIAAPVFIFLEYILYYLPNKVEFDNENIFIKRKKGEERVAIKDIYLVKITAIGIGHKSIWKIKYSNYNGEGVARFYPRNVSSSFGDFLKLVKAANPKAEFKS
jgi:hypothetical protein